MSYTINTNVADRTTYSIAETGPFVDASAMIYQPSEKKKASSQDSANYNNGFSSKLYPETVKVSVRPKNNIYSGLKIPAQNKIPYATSTQVYVQLKQTWTKTDSDTGELYVLPVATSEMFEIPDDDSITLAMIKQLIISRMSLYCKLVVDDELNSYSITFDDNKLRSLIRGNYRFLG